MKKDLFFIFLFTFIIQGLIAQTGGTATANPLVICSGQTSTISLTGYSGTIEWQTDASGSFEYIPGETGSTYVTPALTATTQFRAIVKDGGSDPQDSAISTVATVTVDPLSEGGTATPASSSICSGNSTTITLGGYTGLLIQWQTNASGSFADIPGENGSSYITPALTATTSYRAIVTSGVCSDTSSVATVTVSPVSVGGTATASATSICSGGTTTITLSGYTGSIQWQTNASGSFADISGATGVSYITPALTATTSYQAVVSSGVCTPATSSVATVTVSPVSVGGTATASPSGICSGGTTTITLSGYTGSIQWQTNASGSFADIPGATGASYITPALTATTSYQAVVTSGVCAPANSSAAVVTVSPVSVGGTATASAASLCSGGTSTISLSGYTGSIQWQTNTSGSFADIPGATGVSYITPALTATTSYQAVVTSGVCTPATSSVATVTVSPVSVGGTATASPSGICSGGTTTITLSGYTGSIQWQTNASGSFADIPGATGVSYVTPSLTTSTSYQAVATSGVCAPANSSAAVVTVSPVSVGGTATASAASLCSGGTSTISLSGYAGSIQWQTNASGSFADIPGATGDSYITPALSATTSYRAVVTSGACSSANSSIATVSVSPASVGGTATAASSGICSGESTTVSLSGYTGTIQWQTNESGSFANISGATGVSYVTPALTATTSYRAVVTSGVCPPSNSSAAIVTVSPVSVGGTAAAVASAICSGSTTTINLSGHTGTIQWQSNASGSYADISGETGSSYTTPALTTTTSYRAVVTSGACSPAFSTVATVSVSPTSAGGTATAAPSGICSGESTTINLSGYTGSVQWQTNASGSFINISGATGTSYTTPALTSTTSYRAVVTSGVCPPSNSNEAMVSVSPVSVAGTATAASTSICSGGSTTISLNGHTGSIQWQTNASGSFIDIPGATGSSYTTPSLTTTTSYRAEITSGVCAPANSNAETIVVSPASAGGTATAVSSGICSGEITTINLSGYTGSIQWQSDASGFYADIPGATGVSYTTPSLSATTSYRAIVTSGPCSSAFSSVATVSVSPTSVGGTATASSSNICSGSTTTITLSGHTGSIQWQTNTSGSFVDISGATGTGYTTPALNTTTSYRAIVTSGVCPSATSGVATVSVSPTSAGGTAAATVASLCSGGSTTIILASNVGSIQWQSDASGSFTDIPGATSSSYATPSLTTTTSYRAMVTSGVCLPVASTVATVSVSPVSAGGTATAASASVCTGGSATVNLSGYTGNIQWQTNASGSFADIPGATGSSYTSPALTTTTSYRANVKSGVCPQATSSTVTVSIVPALIGGTAVASPATACTGGTSVISLSGYTGSSIQWQSDASGSFADIPGATSSSYTTTALTTATRFRAVVSGGICAPATSTEVTVSISPASAGGTASASSSSICSSGSITVTLSSYAGSIQWQSNVSGTFTNIPGETGPSYTNPNLTVTTSYRAIVTNGSCSPAFSNVETISVSPLSQGGIATATAPGICSGTGTSITLSSYTGTIQWQSDASGVFTNISGATNPVYNTPPLSSTTRYQAVVTSGVCPPSTSSVATVSISPVSAGGTATAVSSNICSGGTSTISISGHIGTIQWQSDASGSFSNIGESGTSFITPALTATTRYQAIVTSGTCPSATSGVATVSVSPVSAGGIAAATNPSICSGGSTTIVLASYTGSIQWQSDASGSFANISGATNASYNTPVLTTATRYRAIVTSGACPPATSSTATVSIAPPSVGGTVSASPSAICSGSSTTLNLSGNTGTIQWQYSNDGINFTDIIGATGSSYPTLPLSSNTSFRAMVKSGTCSEVPSSVVTVTVSPGSVGGTATASSSAICSGGSTTINLSGHTGTIQWQSDESGPFANISGANGPSYTTPPLTKTVNYRAMVTNGACPSVSSSVVTVSVSPTSVGGTASATTANICSGQNTTLNLSSFTGSIQWQSGTSSSGPFSNIPGANVTTYATPPLSSTTYYRAVVTSGVCPSANSSVATVSVSPVSLGGTATASPAAICSGGSSTISLSGHRGSIQWQSDASGNFTNIPGATGGSYNTPSLTVTTRYRAVLTNGACSFVNSAVATVSVSPVSVGGTATAAASDICSGESTTISLSGYTGTIQWQSSASSSGPFANISGANNATYTTPSLTSTTYYRARVTSGVCPFSNSSIATVSVSPVSLGGTTAASVSSLCSGSSTTISLSGQRGSIQWQRSDASSSFTDIPGASGISYTTPALSATTSYRAVLTNGACAPAFSSITTLTVFPTSAGGIAAAASSNICINGTTTINLSAYTGSIQWQSDASGTFVNIPGATSVSYTTPALTTQTRYRAIVKSGVCPTDTSTVAIVSLVPVLVGGTPVAAPDTVCNGNSTTLTLTGYAGSTIQWQSNASGAFTDIPGAGNVSYITPPLSTPTGYRAIVSSGSCSPATSSVVTISIVPVSVGGAAMASPASICSGDTAVISLSGHAGTIQWQSDALGSFTDISGATGTSYVTPALNTTTRYRALVTNGSCPVASSGVATVNVSPTSQGGTAAATFPSICSGGSTTVLLASYTGSIQWQSDASGTFVNIPGAVSASYTTPSLSSATRYRAVVTSGVCPPDTSAIAAVTIAPPSAGGIAVASPSIICSGSSTTISLSGFTGSIQWQTNAPGAFADIPGATGSSYPTPALTSNTSYRAVVTSGTCASATSGITTVSVSPIPVGGTATAALPAVCTGGSTTISLSGYTGSIQWQSDASGSFTDIPGATGASYITPALNATTRYRAMVSNGACPAVSSAAATVSVSPTSAGGTATAVFPNVCSGGSTTINLSSYTGSVQWQSNASGIFTDIPGATSASYTSPALSATTGYRAVVTSGVCSAAVSGVVTVTVSPVSAGGTATATSYTLCSGGTSTLNLSSHTGAIQWQILASGSFIDIPGATNPSYTSPSLSSTSVYRANVTSGVCPPATSTTVTIVVNHTLPPSGNTVQNFCSVNNPTLAQLIVTGTAIKWYSSATGGSQLLPGTPLADGTSYFASQTINGCESPGRLKVLATLNASPVILSHPDSVSGCPGSSLSFSVTAAGTSLSYQWLLNKGSGFSRVTDDTTYSGSTTPELRVTKIQPGMNGYLFKCVVNGLCSVSDTTNNGRLTVFALPMIMQQPLSATVCSGGDTSFSVTASGSSLSYKWQVNTGPAFVDIVDNTIYKNSNTSRLRITGAAVAMTGYKFRCIVSTSPCGSIITSNNAVITVNNPVPAIAGPDQVLVCGTRSTSLNANNPYPGKGTWSVLGSGPAVSDIKQPNAMLTGLASGKTILKWKTSIEGCKPDSALVSVIVDCKTQLYIPTGFSPNGDGKNDFLVIEGIEHYPDAEITIFNRWGNIVFKKLNYKNDWNGEANTGMLAGQGKLPPGTYFMLIDFKNRKENKSGFLIIKY